MEIGFLDWTPNPVEIISMAAGMSYGKFDVSHERVKRCIAKGHMSVLEHASFTVAIDGISRACSHQLVRHRMASFVQLSQRYTKIKGEDWYVKPDAFSGTDVFDLEMQSCKRAYDLAIENGIKPEDARYLLPEATKTNIVMTMNVRELYHFLSLRTSKAAQWEIRDLANNLIDALCELNDPEWNMLIDWWREYCEEE